MKKSTQLTCNRPSDSWQKGKKSELEKMAKGRGQGERAKEPLFLLLLSSLPRRRFQGKSFFMWGRGGGDEKRAPLKTPAWEVSYSLSLLRSSKLFHVCFPPFSISRHCPLSTIHCPLRLEKACSQWARELFPMPMQGIYRCPFRSI